MIISVLLSLANPMTWLIVAMLAIAWGRFRHRPHPHNKKGAHIARLGVARTGVASAAELGAAFQFLSIAYRPNHAFIAKAQIQQHEDADDDDQGGPDTPRKHILRQLRRIRRGEAVDRLTLRLE